MTETIGRGGGAEQLLATLLPRLREMGLDVELAALFDWPDDLSEELRAAGVPVHLLGIAGPRALPSGVARFARLVRSAPYELLWGHLRLGNFYARLGNLLRPQSKFVATLHSNDYWIRALRPGKASFDLEGMLLRGADIKVAVSQALRTSYSKRLGLADVRVIHNGIDTQAIRDIATITDRGRIRSTWNVGSDDFLVVTPARFVPVKGQQYLLEAMAKLRSESKPVKLVLCGEGPTEAALREQAASLSLGPSLTFAGLLPHDQVIALIAAADAVVMPSLYESFGLVAVEAMAARTVALVTRVDGFEEVVGDSGAAMMVEAGSAAALAGGLGALVGNPALRAELVAAGERRASDFDILLCASAWSDLFRSLERNRPPAHLAAACRPDSGEAHGNPSSPPSRMGAA